ncbi:hypothetical protein JOM56_000949 [Amanita muscaria]
MYMSDTPAKPAIYTNQPPIPEEVLLNLFPQRHYQFLKEKESLQTQCHVTHDNYYWTKADSDLPEEAKPILLECWRQQYWSGFHKLQDYIDEYYRESAQLIQQGKYETKRRSEKAAVTSKVHRDELILSSCSSHTRLKEPQRALERKASALKPHRTSHKGLRVLSRTKPNHAVDVETNSSSQNSPTQVHSEPIHPSTEHLSITFAEDASRLCDSIQGVISAFSQLKEIVCVGSRNPPRVQLNCSARSETRPPSLPSLSSRSWAQPRFRPSNTEPLEITQEGFKPPINAHSRQDAPPTGHSDWKLINAQMSTSLAVAKPRLKSPEDSSRETSNPSQTVMPDVKTDNSPCLATRSQVHAENDDSNSECHALTWEDLTSSHHAEPESTKTHKTQRVSRDPASTLSRVKLSPHMPDVILEPRKPEPENISPAPHSDASDGHLDPRARKPPDKGISKLSTSYYPYAVNEHVDLTSINKCSPPDQEAQIVPLRPTRSLQKLLDSHAELPWRAPDKPQLLNVWRPCKPPDKNIGIPKCFKGIARPVSKLLLPAFDSVMRRQVRMVPRLEPNG